MIGVIADDFTGATDVAVAFRREGIAVGIVFGLPDVTTSAPESDVIVVALKTRTVPSSEAVEDTLHAAIWLQENGCDRLYFKYCSTFDSTAEGNIGPVADALAHHTDTTVTIVTPAAPLHGRTVFQGHLFVGDQLLAESPMKDHPLTPMRDSNLVRLLSHQTGRAVGLIALAVVAAGPKAIVDELSRMQEEGIAYAVVDAVDDADLRTIATAAKDQTLVTGSAGLAAGIASTFVGTALGGAPPNLNQVPQAAAIAGSCSAMTRRQVALFSESNPTFHLDIAPGQHPAAVVDAAMSWFDSLPPDEVPLFTSTIDPTSLAANRDRHDAAVVAELVEDSLAAIACELVNRGIDRIVTAGGETSGAVTSALGVSTGIIGTEAAPGVPWIHTIAQGRSGSQQQVELLLKSGNFGDEDFLISSTRAKRLS